MRFDRLAPAPRINMTRVPLHRQLERRMGSFRFWMLCSSRRAPEKGSDAPKTKRRDAR